MLTPTLKPGDEEVAKSTFSVCSGATVNTGSEWHQRFSCFTCLGSSAAANPLWQLRRRRFILFLFVAGIGGSFQFGFSISSINPPSEYIKNFINETWIERHETPLQEYSLMLLWSFIVSVYPIGGLVGAQIAAIITVKYGRKKSLLCNDIVAIMAAIIMGFSKMARSFEMIVIGRFMSGINTGIGLVAHGLYLGEIAPKELRGAVCMTRAVFVAFGKLMGLVVGLRQILGDENTWHLLLAFSGLPALIQLITLPWFPESPRYLLMERGDQALCIDALRRLWGSGDFTEEVEDMIAERAQMQGRSKMYIIQLFRDKTIRCQLFTAMVVSAGMQLTGINIIYFYASDVYHQLEIPKDSIPFVGIGSSGIELLTSVMCGFVIERVGRKVLLWKGYCFMSVSLLLLIITLSLKVGDIEVGDIEVDDTEVNDIEVGDIEVNDIEVGDIEVGDTEVGDIEVGDIEVGDIEVDDIEVGNIEVNDIEVGDIEVGDTEVGDIEVGDIEVGDTEVGDIEVGDIEVDDTEVGDIEVASVEFCLWKYSLSRTDLSQCMAVNHSDVFKMCTIFPADSLFSLQNALGQFSFFLFVGGCCLASLFTFYVLPETKGKTLLQINEEFNKLRNAKKGICPIFTKRPVVPNQTEILSTRL
ncbi:solute carrier family 2, facilitated glucose transporter member 11-like [Cetorhinus maximus]